MEISIILDMVNHSCKYCNYQSAHAWVVRRHEKNKHGPYQHAPTTMSVDPVQGKGLLAPQPSGNTLYQCRHCTFHHAYQWVVTEHMYTQHPQMYPSAFSSQHPNGAPTTMSFPPVQMQAQSEGGVTQHFDQEDEEDYESEDSNQSRHFLDTTDEEMEMGEEGGEEACCRIRWIGRWPIWDPWGLLGRGQGRPYLGG